MRLTDLRPVLEHPGPFVTVHAEVGRPTEDARQQADARWTTIRHDLEHQSVDDGLIDELGTRLAKRPAASGEVRRTLVGEGEHVLFDQQLAGSVPWPETVDVAMLPELGGWLRQADRQLPFALVVADREGADIGFHPGLAIPDAEQTSVDGEDFQITKVPQGDWAQKQYQRHAENTWQRNADQVAETVRHGVHRHRPSVVLLAGDERARGDIASALDGLDVPLVQLTEGGRGAGASEEALWQGVRRTLDEFEAARDADWLDRLGEAAGHDRAVYGLTPAVEALERAQVELLLVDLDATRHLAVDPARYPGLPLPEAVVGEQPADRVLVAAAAATDAEVSVQPSTFTDGKGVAALLRWE